jgi:hypothetical protein
VNYDAIVGAILSLFESFLGGLVVLLQLLIVAFDNLNTKVLDDGVMISIRYVVLRAQMLRGVVNRVLVKANVMGVTSYDVVFSRLLRNISGAANNDVLFGRPVILINRVVMHWFSCTLYPRTLATVCDVMIPFPFARLKDPVAIGGKSCEVGSVSSP